MIKLRCDKLWYKKIINFLPKNVKITPFEIDKNFYEIGVNIEYDFQKLYEFLKNKVTFTYNPEMGSIQI